MTHWGSDETKEPPFSASRLCKLIRERSAWSAVQKELQKRGAGVNVVDEHLCTPLHYACADPMCFYSASCSGGLLIITHLLEAGANPMARNGRWNTPLHAASLIGNVGAVIILLRCPQVNPNAVGRARNTPIFLAARNGHEEVVRALVDAKANANVLCEEQDTPLHAATVRGLTEVVKVLLTAGADVNRACANGNTVLHVACKRGFLPVVKELLTAGAHIDAVCEKQNTPLYVAIIHGQEEVAVELIRAGANVNAVCERGSTPLLVSCICGRSSLALQLIKAGANVNTRHERDVTPLHWVHVHGIYGEAVAKEMVSVGVDVHARCDRGLSPLYGALTLGGSEGLVRVLVESGADINSFFFEGVCALWICVAVRRDGSLRTILCMGAAFSIAKKLLFASASRRSWVFWKGRNMWERSMTWG